ncbi:MAG: 16S rRNA (cytidine(1402)-2'-O)-methyltransferase [bacterium]|nr:16S rRNA (cytidine(1402)-2'-O)-methyltransferase [bacterium]
MTVVATPIGNLEDLSSRARQALEMADSVACEDTRRTGRLLAHLGLKKNLISLHEHNERARLPSLLEKLESGRQIALVSDAGTPLLSDPGYLLVREAIARGVTVEAVPGPSALLAALVVSALPPHPFTFIGFPPPKSGKRRTFFVRFADLGHTVIFFESPHRLLPSLEDALAVFGDRPAAVLRELTKMHEEALRGTLGALVEQLRDKKPRGEYVIVIGGQG